MVNLHGVYEAVCMVKAAGYEMSAAAPFSEIVSSYDVYYYNDSKERYVRLFRLCERLLNERDTKQHRDKDRPKGG